ncbi:MAG: ribonuclease D [Eggerthellaceae bacterium]|nr:ribonuclease D [Eggerthellaceae bacterium]MDR2715295.1 ribonuclease D [Coriobacteriaceae bacterium]
MYITTQEMLEAFVQRSAASSVLAVDTEFMREKTYYARLCLVQLATDTETVVVDPFAACDLKALNPLFENEGIVKLFHAASQDLEILYRECGTVPRPVFDTQIAAALLGHTQQIGYAALVYSVCEVRLKKIESFTDWSRRPLSDSQLRYAAEDVIYLPRIYASMRAELEEKGRLSWLDDDFSRLADVSGYEVDAEERFRHLRRVNQLSRRQLAGAREFAAWREREAQRKDIPRKWVVGDEQIVEASKREARSIKELFMVRGLKERLNTHDAHTVVSLMVRAFDGPEEGWPEVDGPKKNEPNVDIEIDLMSALVRLRSKESGVAVQTLASHDELSRLARGYRKDLEVLSGWRRTLVGKELLKLLSGEITLSLEKGALKVGGRAADTAGASDMADTADVPGAADMAGGTGTTDVADAAKTADVSEIREF